MKNKLIKLIKSKNTLFFFSFIICMICIVILIININRYNKKRTDIAADGICEIYMHDTATLMEIYVKTSFNSFFNEMNTSYNSFILNDHCNMEDIKSFCKNISSINNREYFAFIDIYGNLYNEEGTNISGKNLSFFYKIKAGEKRIISVSADNNDILHISNPNTITLATSIEPYKLDNHVIIGMVSVIDVEYFKYRLSMDEANDNTFYIASIIKTNGDYIIHNSPHQETIHYTNYYKAFKDNATCYNDFSYERLKSDITKRKSGFGKYSITNKKGYIYYTPINDSELYLLVYMPYDVMKNTIRDINNENTTQYIIIFTIAIFIVLFFFVIYALASKRLIKNMKNAMNEADKARKEADSANKAKSDFLSHISHDIRTPLNGIIGMTDIAKQGNDYSTRVKECLDDISVSSDHLLTLINDVLDMNKIESGKMECQNSIFCIDEVFNECNSIIDGLAKQKEIDFNYENFTKKDIYVLSDKVKIKQILLNILSNSLKYTNKGGNIFFSSTIESIKQSEEIKIKYEIEDNGIGISEEFLNTIFEPFSQESTEATNSYQGFGLGMAIVGNLINLLNGTIAINSCVGKGTKVVVVLPLKLEKNIEKSIDYSMTEVLASVDNGQNILLVEDNKMNMKIAYFLLSSFGNYNVIKAYDGFEAVEIFEKSKPYEISMIFMDLMMPNLDGIDATKRIRDLYRADSKDIPIIAMTANAFSDSIIKSKEAGMTDYIIKPIDKGLLKQLVYKYSKKNNILSNE